MTLELSPLTSELVLRNNSMKPRLLATDPDPVLLQMYRNYFPNFGFEVAAAHDGMGCVELLREFAPDALVLSLELMWGGADGVLSIIREEERWRPIPVVLTVGDTSRPRAVRHLLPPVVKLLEKPFRLRDLRAIIEGALHVGAERLAL
jgi:DNA-binding response OmpR family regulator